MNKKTVTIILTRYHQIFQFHKMSFLILQFETFELDCFLPISENLPENKKNEEKIKSD